MISQDGNLLNVNCDLDVPLWVGQHKCFLVWKSEKPNSGNKMASLVNTEQEGNGTEHLDGAWPAVAMVGGLLNRPALGCGLMS